MKQLLRGLDRVVYFRVVILSLGDTLYGVGQYGVDTASAVMRQHL